MLKIYNSLSKTFEEFKPTNPNNVKIYICGPTVYDHSHIGHARTFMTFNVIRNILEKHYGYDVTVGMNITDIDDKIIKKSEELNQSVKCVSNYYTKEFFNDMKILRIQLPNKIAKVSENIDIITKFIDKLIDNNNAYKSNGSVYFNVEFYRKSFQYPIFNQDPISISTNADKKFSLDWALWKKSTNGYLYKDLIGRPGWHIECSAIANDIFNDCIDIHVGGIDLKFPHHENEIAQCQAYYNKKPWINYFMHIGHLNINGLKMSKSLKNYITIKSILEKCTSNQLGILFLLHQWNKNVNYNEQELAVAKSIETSLYSFITRAEDIICLNNINKSLDDIVYDRLSECKLIVDKSFSDNLDTSSVLHAILNLCSFTVSKLNDINGVTLTLVYDYVLKILDILNIEKPKTINLIKIIKTFRNDVRTIARESNNQQLFKICDNVRNILKESGYFIEDNDHIN